MSLLILGLALFLGGHTIPAVPGLRAGLLARMGERPYRVAFSLVSAAGLALVVIGFARAPSEPRWFDPSLAAMHAARVVVPLAFVLIAAAHMKSHLRARLGHPMLIATLLWSAVHFLANGEERTSLLFGGFFIWTVLDLVSLSIRPAKPRDWTPAIRYDAMALAGGLILGLAVMALHRVFFGVAVVNWGF
jgi:uncharacterized membrane protein